jgi:hypothetical protein
MVCTLDARRMVFVGECGAHTSLAPLYAWAPRGKRAYSKVPRNRGKNTTLPASMTLEGTGPCLAVVGSTTRKVFEAYVERVNYCGSRCQDTVNSQPLTELFRAI